MAKAKAFKKSLDKISKKMDTLKLKAKSVDPFAYPDVRKKAATKLRVKQNIKKLTKKPKGVGKALRGFGKGLR